MLGIVLLIVLSALFVYGTWRLHPAPKNRDGIDDFWDR